MLQQQERPAFRRVRFVRPAAGFAAAFLLTLVLPPQLPSPAADAKPFLEEIGQLDRAGADARAALGSELVPNFATAGGTHRGMMGTAVAIPEMRQLWQIYPHPTLSTIKTGIVVRDLDSLKIVRTLVLDARIKRATRDADQGDWTHAVDTVKGRLFLVGCSCASTSATFAYEFDLRSFEMKRWNLLGSLDPVSTNFTNLTMVGGITYDPVADDLLVLYHGVPAIQTVDVSLYRIDLGGSSSAPFDPTRLYRIRACTGPVSSASIGDDTYDWEILVGEQYLYVPCMQAGHTVIVVRMQRPARGTDPRHVEDVVAGPVYGESVLADQKAGRLFVVTYQTQEIWTFEATTMSFVGVVATGPGGTQGPTGYGLDRATGRVFFQSPYFGLGVVEGRFFPIPQARTLPRRAEGEERILSDAATNRVFVLEGHSLIDPGESGKAPAYKIYRIEPAPAPPPPADPDRNTADTDEREGVTEARWNASASGYGTRVLWAKGYATIVPAPTLGVNAPTSVLGKALADRCGYTDRDIFAGRVVKSEYDTGSTAAAAVAMDVDGSSRQDLNDLARCFKEIGTFLGTAAEPHANSVSKDHWPYGAASCASSEGYVPTEPSKGTGSPDLGPSSASCPAPGGLLEAHAETKLSGNVGVEVDRSWSHTTIERTSGVRATVEAVAQGVSIVGEDGVELVTIGEIRSTATSVSNGRPRRDDMSQHAMRISQVRMGNEVICREVCSDEELGILESTLNVAAGGRARFRTGKGPTSGRDEGLVRGSNRGAQTAVQKSVARQASDRSLLGDFTIELPAFEITVFNDNPDTNPTWGPGWGRARQVYQFAAVASSATYNVVVRPTFLPFDDSGALPDEPALAEAGSTPYGDLIEQVDDTGYVLGPTQPTGGNGNRKGGGGFLGDIAGALQAVGRGIRLFLTSPRHALLLLTAWALLSSPAVLSRRRRLLTGVRSS